MCTAIRHHGIHHLLGRTLDLERSYGETVVLAPRNFPHRFLYENTPDLSPAICGTACVRNGVPLYYDAMNECGLAVAALNFPQNAVYRERDVSVAHNVASFELIPWLLCHCRTCKDATELLRETNITGDAFSPELPPTPLHWIVSDMHGAIVVEAVASGLELYDDPFGVLTNSPPFPYHVTHAADYAALGASAPDQRLCGVPLVRYSRGMGAIGLPGDFSSASRFVRAVFAEHHTKGAETEREEISRFFRVMDTVAVPNGCILTESGESVRTVYTSCADADTGTYYFTTYDCRRIRAVRMHAYDLNSDALVTFPMAHEEEIEDA